MNFNFISRSAKIPNNVHSLTLLATSLTFRFVSDLVVFVFILSTERLDVIWCGIRTRAKLDKLLSETIYELV